MAVEASEVAIAVDAVAASAATEVAVVVAVVASATEAVVASVAVVAVAEIEVVAVAAEVALALVPRSLSSPIPVSQESSCLVERMISFLQRTPPLESPSTTKSVFQLK